MWDLCNEPFALWEAPQAGSAMALAPFGELRTHKEFGWSYLAPSEPMRRAELSFWSGAAETVRLQSVPSRSRSA